jgi:hypothetical protein
MKHLYTLLTGLALALTLGGARADAVPGQPAPSFRLSDTAGRPVSLADYRGRIVVLEWVNHGCPFVRKHYGSGNMQALQQRYVAKGVVWLSIQSTHPDHPDYQAPDALAAAMRAAGAAQTATLLDADGAVGRLYGARTTPHMYLVDAAGVLAYAGAIDDIRSAKPEDVQRASNHVAASIDALLAGRAVPLASTVPYGCSVKYR